MPRYAPVVPLSIARMLKEAKILGNYHLLLAHDILAHPHEYREVYGHLQEDAFKYIILDNSVIELGEPLPPKDLLKAADIVKADVIVLPDVLRNKDATVEAVKAGIQELGGGKYALMALPQGEKYSSWQRCVEEFDRIPGFSRAVTTIGIPRNVRQHLGHSRVDAAIFVKCILNPSNMHMFGFSNDVHDDMLATTTVRGVSGIDSAFPVWLANHYGLEIYRSLTDDERKLQRGDWWESHEAQKNFDLVKYNINQVRYWLNFVPRYQMGG